MDEHLAKVRVSSIDILSSEQITLDQQRIIRK